MTEKILKKEKKNSRGVRLHHVIIIVLAAMIMTAVGTFFLIQYTLFGTPLKPVKLSAKEQIQFEKKMLRFGQAMQSSQPAKETTNSTDEEDFQQDGSLTPKAYNEEKLSRTIEFTEREINALIANNTDLADKVAVDFEEELISVRLRLPMDRDVPMIGGKILKIHAGAEVACEEGRPIVKLRGVSLMGIPLPNAWLGGMKDVDLVEKSGGIEGDGGEFWQTFAEGVEDIHISEGKLHLQLKE